MILDKMEDRDWDSFIKDKEYIHFSVRLCLFYQILNHFFINHASYEVMFTNSNSIYILGALHVAFQQYITMYHSNFLRTHQSIME